MKHTAKRILCLLLAAFLCAGLVCVTAFAEPAQAEELPAEGTLARNVLDNCKYTLDLGSWSTLASEGGAGHLQGICTDDEGNYMYASFTNMLVKVDIQEDQFTYIKVKQFMYMLVDKVISVTAQHVLFQEAGTVEAKVLNIQTQIGTQQHLVEVQQIYVQFQVNGIQKLD